VVGFAVIDAPFVALNPVEGAHEYEVAPDAASAVLLPLQIGEGVVTAITGFWLTVTMTIEVAMQPLPLIPVVVYVVVVVGLAVTDAPLVALNPIDGVHVYEAAPDAASVVLLSLQIGAGVATVIVGFGFILTATCVVVEHPLLFVPVME